MTCLGDEQGELLPRRTGHLDVGTQAMASELQRVKRRRGTTGTEQAGWQGRNRFGAGRDVAGKATELREHGALHQREDGRCFERGASRVQRRTEPIAHDGHRIGSGEVLVDEPGVAGVHRMLDDQVDGVDERVVAEGAGIVGEAQLCDRREGGRELVGAGQFDHRIGLARRVDDVAQRPSGDPFFE